ncbi:hypothetical protein OPT61_g9134 [Boeremia exigua]|uniref:Uncharacterized protein n=1 Tax=Boeremia exigua TaxID=749465 RepID=A0ACC2HVD8_9PLEO|nr:hypothetical protein OPT61_g9134 [Boeremia exigua]
MRFSMKKIGLFYTLAVVAVSRVLGPRAGPQGGQHHPPSSLLPTVSQQATALQAISTSRRSPQSLCLGAVTCRGQASGPGTYPLNSGFERHHGPFGDEDYAEKRSSHIPSWIAHVSCVSDENIDPSHSNEASRTMKEIVSLIGDNPSKPLHKLAALCGPVYRGGGALALCIAPTTALFAMVPFEATLRNTFGSGAPSSVLAMFSAFDHLDWGLDDSGDDTLAHEMPYYGGDIPYSELGNSDEFAALIEPGQIAMDTSQFYKDAGAVYQSAPIPTERVLGYSPSRRPDDNTILAFSTYQTPTILGSAANVPASSLPTQYSPAHPPDLVYPYGSHEKNPSTQMIWHHPESVVEVPIVSQPSFCFEQQPESYMPSYAANHYDYQGRDQYGNVLAIPGSSTFQPQQYNQPFPYQPHDRLMIPRQSHDQYKDDLPVPGSSTSQMRQNHQPLPGQPPDQHTDMGRSGSQQSLSSVDSGLVHASTVSLSSQIDGNISCCLCGASFSGKYCKRNLTRHKQTVHPAGEVLMYHCKQPNCRRAYKRSDALRVHQSKKHPGSHPPPRPRR